MRNILLKKQDRIAKFMGWETENNLVKVPNLYPIYNIQDSENTGWTEEEITKLEFLDRWDWLMPVIEKICKLKFTDGSNDTCYPRTFGMIGGDGMCMVRFNRFSLHSSEKLIEAAFLGVIEVIDHLNSKNCYLKTNTPTASPSTSQDSDV